jgi:hypothetical protein
MPTDPSPAQAGARPSRRTFLTSAALTGVAVGAGTWTSTSAAATAPPEVPSAAQPTASCGLELEGARAGGLQSVSGGGIVSGVYGKTENGDIRRKRPVDIRYEDITITTGTGMSKAFYQDVAGAAGGGLVLRRGRVTTRDGSGAVTRVRRFRRAQLTEVAFPPLDASSEQAALMTVKFSPLGFYTNPAAGPKQPTPSTATWLQNGFRLQISGVDCSHVSQIRPIVIRLPNLTLDDVNPKQPTPTPPTDYSNLVITMPESNASSLYKWSESLVTKIKPDERSGQLEFLSTTGSVLFTVKFSHLGVFTIEPSTVSVGSDSPPEVTASIYCEQMTFSHTAAALA